MGGRGRGGVSGGQSPNPVEAKLGLIQRLGEGGIKQAGCVEGGSIDVYLYDILAPPHPHIRVLVGLFICCYLCIYLSSGYWSGH